MYLLFSGSDISTSTFNLFLPWSDACFIPLGGRMINKEESALEPYTGDYLWNRRLSHNHHCVHCLSKSWYTCELSSYGFLQKSFTESKVGTVNVVKDGHHSLSDCFAILHNVGQNGGCCREQVHIALCRLTIRTSSRCHHTEYCSFRQKNRSNFIALSKPG